MTTSTNAETQLWLRTDVQSLMKQRDAIDAEIVERVVEARRAGLSWSKIGEVLGYTRQRAWGLFHEETKKAGLT